MKVFICWAHLSICIAALFLGGCQGEQWKIAAISKDTDTIGALTANEQRMEVIKTVYKTNWLATTFIVGIALSIAALFTPARAYALGGLLGCIVGLVSLGSYQAFAVSKWLPIATACATLGVCIAAAVIGLWRYAQQYFEEHTALKEVVRGNESLKAKIDAGTVSRVNFKETQNLFQSKMTQAKVKAIKKEITA